ncbi:Integral membrane alanine and leucine rich protein OS=Tsukamurella paurometabola (strain ATCC 8368/ DSM / CCUG 35730 / CIP 100753 / JCM 10117 / KCTC 9821/ NBRC 16120 / NCIMB 702349 / NCTC 13040) OX=521096 GN=Tpau_1887 PE=4 SV=1 [Tsukamurella paurometabola]|uniref:Integral membrane alanine and leucine rich protein n=1 Tax=Tsukamurella paurometabola (strain ATCC 8368 / DSM 20162 / CCUG 35730 / CIP 100753 / JCM 10117 / KCTC 9821 / NBRC 16120 / NCIMB 702349 / NCTC 13040) TaxID=521096 RepID=D5UN03_TSUPD|nr:integral membrane alanine and leucine rich protein [Tsukamurella paurometabola DSM 20162]SUP31932.1 Protein of uncharacterised function (DUF3159) [Tsukamurella paurometabola]
MSGADAAEPSIRDQVLDQMGGWQGLVYSALPVAAFVPANAVWGLKGGVITALVVAAIVMVIRLATRTSIQPAISGFFGVAVCVVIALIVGGNGKGYYLYGIVMQAVLAVVFAISIIVRWPLVGVLWHLFDERSKQAVDDGHDWRADRRQYRGFVWLTVMWFAMFTVRFVVQLALYLGDDVNWLGVARIAMGWPMFAAGLLITFLVARKLTHADDE